jgi:hypothetical protein
MSLTQDQLKHVRTEVDKSGISIVTLKDDVLDHVCCETEARMKSGKSFQDSLMEAIYELAPEGLKQLEADTMYLLNQNKHLHMKKITFFVGFVCSMQISLGWLFKFLEPNSSLGNLLFGVGFFGFLSLFVPLLAIHYLKTIGRSVPEKIRFVSGSTSIIMIGLAVLARLMHMPGADQVMVGGLTVFTFAFLPTLFFTMYRNSSEVTNA